jgi:hypothetical protein
VRAQAAAPSAYGLGALRATTATLLMGCGLLSGSREPSALVLLLPPLLLLPAARRLPFLSEALMLQRLLLA